MEINFSVTNITSIINNINFVTWQAKRALVATNTNCGKHLIKFTLRQVQVQVQVQII